MRSSRGERAAPRGARHAGLGLQLDGRWEAEAASQPAEWRRRRQGSGVDAPAPTRPEGPGLTPALALLRRRHLLPRGPRSSKIDAPGGPSRRAHLLPCAPAPTPPTDPVRARRPEPHRLPCLPSAAPAQVLRPLVPKRELSAENRPLALANHATLATLGPRLSRPRSHRRRFPSPPTLALTTSAVIAAALALATASLPTIAPSPPSPPPPPPSPSPPPPSPSPPPSPPPTSPSPPPPSPSPPQPSPSPSPPSPTSPPPAHSPPPPSPARPAAPLSPPPPRAAPPRAAQPRSEPRRAAPPRARRRHAIGAASLGARIGLGITEGFSLRPFSS